MRSTIFAALLLLVPGMADAQTPPTGVPAPAGGAGQPSPARFPIPSFRPTLTATTRSLYAAESGTSDGRLSVFRGSLDLQWADRNPLKKRFITVTGRVESLRFLPKRARDRSLYEDMASFRLAADTVFLSSRDRGTVVGLAAEFSGSQDARFSDGVLPAGYVGQLRLVRPGLNYTYGIFVLGQLEDRPLIVPLVGVEWQPRPNQVLLLRGTELRYTWGANPTFGRPGGPPPRRSLSLLVNVEPQRNYRLSRRNGVSEGVLRDINVRVGAELTESFHENGTSSLFIGGLVYRRLRFDDREGERVTTVRVDPTLTVGGSVNYRF
ncbi:MAG: hypothetical protein SFU56_22695 [Capsulimonadales bacterium]|nr:hypothetical protein [Capsulimonadales bacterium]